MKTFSLPCYIRFLLAFLDFKRCKTAFLSFELTIGNAPLTDLFSQNFWNKKQKIKHIRGASYINCNFITIAFYSFFAGFSEIKNDNTVLIPSEYIISAVTFISAGISVYPVLTNCVLWYAVFLQ